jgi:hypothetical protein
MPDTLLPARQKSVRFYGDVIFAVQLDDERIFVRSARCVRHWALPTKGR